jgi:hypothetical protein
MMRTIAALLLAFISFCSCDRVSDTTKEKINSGAETVGKTATDAVNSIGKGISRGAALEIVISDALTKKGVSFGKYYLSRNKSGNKNTVSLYLISDQSINTKLKLKLYDKQGVEMGRLEKTIKQDAGQAGYHDFVFDDRISIENKSKITID